MGYTEVGVGVSRDLILKNNIKESIFYTIFLLLLTMLTYESSDSNMIYFNRAFNKIIDEICHSAPFKFSFHEGIYIKSTAEFWQLLEYLFLHEYYTFWYANPRNMTLMKIPDLFTYTNKAIGLPRLRQIRVIGRKCNNPIIFKSRSICHDDYSSTQEEKSKWKQWDYMYENDTNAISWTYAYGRYINYYSNGGYVQDIDISSNENTTKTLQMLKKSKWIDEATRAIFLDFSILNPNINRINIIKLVFEFDALGSILMSNSFQDLKLLHYVTPRDHVILAMEMFLVTFLIFYTLEDLYEIITRLSSYGWTICQNYIFDIWNICDRFVFCVIYFNIWFRIYSSIEIWEKALNYTDQKYINFENLALWQYYAKNYQGFCMFIAWIKLFKYFNIDGPLGKLIQTMSRSIKDIVEFSLIFFVVFIGFAHLGYFLFGAQSDDFNTFRISFVTLLRTILGDFSYDDIEITNRVLGPFFFSAYIFLVFFILINMFLAIVNETYSHVKESMNEDTKQNVCKFLKAGFRQMFCRKLPSEPLSMQTVTGEEDEVQKLENLTQAFKNLNFTEREIDLFLSKYEIKGKKHLEESDTERILSGIYSDLDKEDKDKMILTKKHYDRLCILEEHVVTLNEKFDKYVQEISKVIKKKREERLQKEIEERNRQRIEEKNRQKIGKSNNKTN